MESPPAFVRLPPRRPEGLSPEAVDLWDEVVEELSRLQLIKVLDGAGLQTFVETWALWLQATREVQAHVAETGTVTVSNTSVRKDGTEHTWQSAHPAIAVARNAQAAVRAWCSEYGMTPSSESKLRTPGVPDGEEGDPFS